MALESPNRVNNVSVKIEKPACRFWGMEVSSFRLMAIFLLIINSNKEKFKSFTIGEYFITQKTWSKYPVLLHYLWYRIGGINSPVLGHILGPFIIYKLIVPFLGPVFVPVNIYYMPLFSGLLIFIVGAYIVP